MVASNFGSRYTETLLDYARHQPLQPTGFRQSLRLPIDEFADPLSRIYSSREESRRPPSQPSLRVMTVVKRIPVNASYILLCETFCKPLLQDRQRRTQCYRAHHMNRFMREF